MTMHTEPTGSGEHLIGIVMPLVTMTLDIID